MALKDKNNASQLENADIIQSAIKWLDQHSLVLHPGLGTAKPIDVSYKMVEDILTGKAKLRVTIPNLTGEDGSYLKDGQLLSMNTRTVIRATNGRSGLSIRGVEEWLSEILTKPPEVKFESVQPPVERKYNAVIEIPASDFDQEKLLYTREQWGKKIRTEKASSIAKTHPDLLSTPDDFKLLIKARSKVMEILAASKIDATFIMENTGEITAFPGNGDDAETLVNKIKGALRTPWKERGEQERPAVLSENQVVIATDPDETDNQVHIVLHNLDAETMKGFEKRLYDMKGHTRYSSSGAGTTQKF